MKPTKLFAVMTHRKGVLFGRNLEAVFSTFEEVEKHINQLFPNIVNTTREICEIDLDPYESQVKNKYNYYFLFATLENDHYQIQVDKTSDHIFCENLNKLDIEGPTNSQPDFSYYYFAASAEEALMKFKADLLPYMKAHNINFPFAEPEINLKRKYFY